MRSFACVTLSVVEALIPTECNKFCTPPGSGGIVDNAIYYSRLLVGWDQNRPGHLWFFFMNTTIPQSGLVTASGCEVITVIIPFSGNQGCLGAQPV